MDRRIVINNFGANLNTVFSCLMPGTLVRKGEDFPNPSRNINLIRSGLAVYIYANGVLGLDERAGGPIVHEFRRGNM